MKKLVIVTCALAALATAVAQPAQAGVCGLPTQRPLWIDFGDGSVPFWQTFAKPGLISAAANFIYPPRIRALGGKTVYWDMYLNSRRVGTPTDPAEPDEVIKRAHRLFDYAVASSGCNTPFIAENELFGANLPTPWAPKNAQYRANVLLYLRTLAGRGARPFLLVSSAPYTLGEAADWWRQVAQVADIVREVYFAAPALYAQGPIMGSRALRLAFRRGIADFAAIGIPITKLGIMLGFHTAAGTGGREGLQPAQAWFETIKWQALAARQVASELRMATVWSWGWANWNEQGFDPDKPAGACVWLWVRNPKFCDGPRAAGDGFEISLREGQLSLPAGVKCTVDRRNVGAGEIATLTRLTGERDAAFSSLFARAVEAGRIPLTTRQISAAERVLVSQRFGGSYSAYRSAVAEARLTIAGARAVIADEVRRAQVKAGIRVKLASATELADYHTMHGQVLARPVHVTPAPQWLGGRKTGFALATTAPARVFSAPTGRRVKVRSLSRQFTIRPLQNTRPLSLVPLGAARASLVAALADLRREEAFHSWSVNQQRRALRRTICTRDELPSVGEVRLTDYLPFLELR